MRNGAHLQANKQEKKDVLTGAFFWLAAFYVVYCARPTDFVPGLQHIPLAKITALLATGSLFLSAGKSPRKLKDLPPEGFYLIAIIAVLMLSAVLSPVWKGGAVFTTVDFSKVSVAWLLTFLLVTTFQRLKRLILIQSVSVALVTSVALIKGHSVPRLSGVIGGFYSNPNDMAFAIVLSIPFCVAFMISTKGAGRKLLWALAILCMAVALLLTASRAGFIDLIFAGTVCLWQFGIKGRRPALIAGTVIISALLLLFAGRTLLKRFTAIAGAGDSRIEVSAEGSYEERKLLMVRALDAIVHYPILGVGAGNFVVYSGLWKEVHASYLQIAAEGGIPGLLLYLMFFVCGYKNLRHLGKTKSLDKDAVLFVGALKSSLVGFSIGACFAPEVYQFFPYFTVCYTSVLLAMQREQAFSLQPSPQRLKSMNVFGEIRPQSRRVRASEFSI